MSWGVSDLLNEMLSREPARVATPDIEQLQTNLIEQGYARPDTPVDGVWNPSYQSAFSRMERDAFESQQSGNKVGSTSVADAIKYLSYTTPQGVWQGILGTAKGIKEQAGETAENLGLVGGAVAGAALGSIVPGVGTAIGAGVGAVAGGIAGFAADLFGDDEEEDSNTNDFLDALSPWDEYAGEGGGEQFWADLNLVASAASLLSGAGIAARGVQTGIIAGRTAAQGMGAAAALGGQAASKGAILKAALAAKTPGQPGLVMNMLTGAKAPITGGLIGGAAGGLLTGEEEGFWGGALMGATLGFGGKTFSEPIRAFLTNRGLMAQASRPFIKTINGAFTGASAAGLGSRLASDVAPNISDVERSIDKETSETINPVWDAVGLIVYPMQLLPFKAGAAADKLSSMAAFKPGASFAWDVAIQGDPALRGMNRVQRRRELLKRLSPVGDENDNVGIANSMFQLALDNGRFWKAHERTLSGEVGTNAWRADLIKRRSEMARNINTELEAMAKGEKASTETIDEMLSFMVAGPDHRKSPITLTTWLTRLEGGRGRGVLDGIQQQVQAQAIARDANRAWSAGNLDAVVAGGVRKIDNPEYLQIQGAITDAEKRAADIDVLKAADPSAAQAQKQTFLDQAEELKKQLENVDTKVGANQQLTIANVDDLENRIVGVATEQDIDGYISQLDRAADTFRTLDAKIQKAADPAVIGKEVDDVLRALTNEETGLIPMLRFRELITAKQAKEVLEAVAKKDYKPIKTIVRHLKEGKHLAPQDVTVPDEWLAKLPEGKKFVVTGEDIINFDPIEASIIGKNLDLFGTQKEKWETLRYTMASVGLSPLLNSDMALTRYRQAASEAAIEEGIGAFATAKNIKLPITGRQIVHQLWEGVKADAANSSALGPLQRRTVERSTKAGVVESVKTELPILELRQLDNEKIIRYLDLENILPGGVDVTDVAHVIKDGIQRGSALRSNMDILHPLDSMKQLGRNMQLDGLPGFVDWMRQWHFANPGHALGSGIAGGVGGAVVGAEEDGWSGAGQGLLLGAGIASGAHFGNAKAIAKLGKAFPKGSYGYLPDHLHRFSMAARYTFSLAFDMGRYMENALISTTKEGLPYILKADRYVQRNAGRSLYSRGIVGGKTKEAQDAAFDEMWRYYSEVTRDEGVEAYDELLRWTFQRGVVGYAPKEQEAARAYLIARRDADKGINVHTKSYLNNMEQRIRKLEGYGTGRRTIEKSVNFVFFPFSFQKKLISTLGDFITQAPARALLIHEGMRMFDRLGADENSRDFIEKYIPLADQLKRLNNLSYGLSPGRFFLEGLADPPWVGTGDKLRERRNMGKLMQGLASVMVPSGSNTPIAQAFGGLGDSAVHLFTPNVITGRTGVQEIKQVLTDFIPAGRDIQRMATGIDEQIAATTEGGAPYYQLQQYLDGKRAAKAKWLPVASQFTDGNGNPYTEQTLDNFFSTSVGSVIKKYVDKDVSDLGMEFRRGHEMANEFEGTSEINKQALYALASDESRSPAEDAIIELAQVQALISPVAEAASIPIATSRAIFARQMRVLAAKWQDDPEFQALWSRFFSYEFGPLARTAA